jgi:hypothetical protein
VKKKIPVEKLLRWRFEKARTEAPLPPSAASLVSFARPWWETSPERFQLVVRRLGSIQIAHGRPTSKSPQSRVRGRVPTLLVRTAEEIEISVCILSLSLNKGRMQISFKCETMPEPDEQMFEATLVSEGTSRPFLCALTDKSLDNDYRLSAKVPDDLAKEWERLKLTDRMPFRLILRSMASPS